MIILDTDHCITTLRQKLDLGDHIAAEAEVFITSITVSELTHGANCSLHLEDNLSRLEVLFAAPTVLPLTKWLRGGVVNSKLNLKNRVSRSMIWICK